MKNTMHKTGIVWRNLQNTRELKETPDTYSFEEKQIYDKALYMFGFEI